MAQNGERLNAQPWDFDDDEESDGDLSGSDVEDDDEFDDMEIEFARPEDRDPPKPFGSLEKLFRDNPKEIGDEEEREIVSLLKSIFQHGPLKRPSASDLLEHPWIKA